MQEGEGMSEPAGSATPQFATGRNPYDAAVEILRMLSRTAPWFVFLAGLAYAIQQIYAVARSTLAFAHTRITSCANSTK